MILLNDHFTQGHVRPYVPAMVEVGGLQIKPKPDPLPSVSLLNSRLKPLKKLSDSHTFDISIGTERMVRWS